MLAMEISLLILDSSILIKISSRLHLTSFLQKLSPVELRRKGCTWNKRQRSGNGGKEKRGARKRIGRCIFKTSIATPSLRGNDVIISVEFHSITSTKFQTTTSLNKINSFVHLEFLEFLTYTESIRSKREYKMSFLTSRVARQGAMSLRVQGAVGPRRAFGVSISRGLKESDRRMFWFSFWLHYGLGC